jgi:hypothetical protein
MKKIIVCLTLSAVALIGALHAADTKPMADKDKGSCCDKAKGSCCADKSACSKTPSKGVAMSPKATEQAAH